MHTSTKQSMINAGGIFLCIFQLHIQQYNRCYNQCIFWHIADFNTHINRIIREQSRIFLMYYQQYIRNISMDLLCIHFSRLIYTLKYYSAHVVVGHSSFTVSSFLLSLQYLHFSRSSVMHLYRFTKNICRSFIRYIVYCFPYTSCPFSM